jgi:hypothetical protein
MLAANGRNFEGLGFHSLVSLEVTIIETRAHAKARRGQGAKEEKFFLAPLLLGAFA